MSTTAIQTIQRQIGFTLIEAMVALLIFSAGLLGLAGMQMSGMQNNQSAILQTVAVQQTYNMAERIRANLTDANTGSYDALNSGSVSCTTDTSTCGSSVPQLDFALWYNATQEMLPQGSGTVTGVAVDNDGDGTNDSRLFTITISWVEPSGNANVTLDFQP